MGLFLEKKLNSRQQIWSKNLKNFYKILLISQNSQISVRSESFLENEILNPAKEHEVNVLGLEASNVTFTG
jgi:hypothetical protein